MTIVKSGLKTAVLQKAILGPARSALPTKTGY